MNILVISGSPKGENSITLQTALYLEKLRPEHNFTVLHVGRTYRSLERDFSPAARELARAETGGNFLAGVATDESDPDGEIDALAARLAYAVDHRYVQPANFYGVGGMKIFRDLIWQMQGLMREDHRFYKEHGQYDFPQKHRAAMLAMYLVGAMASNPKVQAKMGNKMTEGMLMPYQRVLKKTQKRAKRK